MAKPSNILAAVCLLLLIGVTPHANSQQQGFSKTFVYKGDSLGRSDFSFSSFIFDSIQQSIIFPYTSSTQQMNQNNNWVKLDLSGNIIHSNTTAPPNSRYVVYETTKSSNNDATFYATGFHFKNDIDTFQTLFLEKLDYNLNRIWIREFPMTYTQIWPRGLFALDEDHIILAPVLERSSNLAPLYSHVSPFANLMKFDTAGNLIWHKSIDSSIWNGVQHAIKAHDGSIMLCGITKGYGTPDNGAAWVMKVDTAGNKLWHRTYNLPGYDGLEKMVATADGNYVCVGGTELPPEIQDMPKGGGRILKIDEDGDVIWDKIINDNPRGGSFSTIVVATNGDIVTFGNSAKYYAYAQYNYQVGSTRAPDGWAVRLDVNGNEVWNRVFGHNAVPHAHEYLYNAIALPDGGFIASGNAHISDTLWQNGSPQQYSRSAAWVIKLDANGCVDTACSEILNVKESTKPQYSISLYPNPGNGKALLKAKQPLPANTQISITDIMGRTVWQTAVKPGSQQIPIDISPQPSGVYLIRLQAGAEVYSLKYIIND